MSDFTPDQVKIAKQILGDIFKHSLQEVLKFQREEDIVGFLKVIFLYVDELERFPHTVQHYLDSKRDLEKSLDSLKELCRDNHR